MYHLQLFKDNSDERKTLTKVSTRKPLTNIPQNKSAHLGTRKPGNRMQNKETGKRVPTRQKPVKSCLHNWWRTRALGFHQIQAKTHQEKRKNQRKTRKARNGFCIKLYIDFLCKKSQTFHAIREILIISIKIYRYIFQIQNFIYILLHKLKPQKTAVTLKQTVTRK